MDISLILACPNIPNIDTLKICIELNNGLEDLQESLSGLGPEVGSSQGSVCCKARALIWSYLSSTSFWLQWKAKEDRQYLDILYSMAIVHCRPKLSHCGCLNSSPIKVIPPRIATTPASNLQDPITWDRAFFEGLVHTLSEGSPPPELLPDCGSCSCFCLIHNYKRAFLQGHPAPSLRTLVKVCPLCSFSCTCNFDKHNPPNVIMALMKSRISKESMELHHHHHFALAIMNLMESPAPPLKLLMKLEKLANIIIQSSSVNSHHSGISRVISLSYAVKLYKFPGLRENISYTWKPFNTACLMLFGT